MRFARVGELEQLTLQPTKVRFTRCSLRPGSDDVFEVLSDGYDKAIPLRRLHRKLRQTYRPEIGSQGDHHYQGANGHIKGTPSAPLKRASVRINLVVEGIGTELLDGLEPSIDSHSPTFWDSRMAQCKHIHARLLAKIECLIIVATPRSIRLDGFRRAGHSDMLAVESRGVREKL